MNRIVIVLALLLVGFTSFASAQDKVAMYPYSVFNHEPLKVGSTVWVNVGDDQCTYGYWRRHPDSKFTYAMPSASDDCFRQYYKAVIVKIYSTVWEGWSYTKPGVDPKFVRERSWWYRVKILNFGDPKDTYEFKYGGEFDRLYEIYNLPDRWSYSKYFLALNW